jgi:hypothetical protein
MIEATTVRNMSPATQRSYISAVSKFSRYFGKSPERLGLEDVGAFQVHLVSTGVSWPGLNQIVYALRFFYGVTLDEADVPERIPYARAPSVRASSDSRSIARLTRHAGPRGKPKRPERARALHKTHNNASANLSAPSFNPASMRSASTRTPKSLRGPHRSL